MDDEFTQADYHVQRNLEGRIPANKPLRGVDCSERFRTDIPIILISGRYRNGRHSASSNHEQPDEWRDTRARGLSQANIP